LKKWWSDRIIEILIQNAPELHHGLQILEYYLGDMYTITHKMTEDIEFQRWINVKLNSEKKST
jgi:hypothetical protein